MSAKPSLPLLIDLQAVQSLAHGERGIARYAASQTRSLLKTPGAVRTIFLNPAMPGPKNLEPALTQPPLAQWNTSRAVRRALAAGPAAFYLTSPMEISPPYSDCIISPHTIGSGMPLVVTLYDLIPAEMPERYLTNQLFARQYRQRLRVFGAADLVLAISEYSRDVAIRMLGLHPDRIVSIGGGADDFFREPRGDPAAGRRALERIGITRPFLVSVLGQDPRKNLEGLVEAFGSLPRNLRRNHQLVIVGKYDEQAMGLNRKCARSCGLSDDDIVFTGRISDDDLRELYRAARLFVFPSIAEGFGLPVAEAIACGCPAITSNVSALPEILDWEPAAFDPHSISAMAGKIEQGLVNEAFRTELLGVARSRAPVHTWDQVAQRTLYALDRVGPLIRRSARSLPRVALVGPFPPQQSGVGDYNARITAELAPRCDLHVFSEDAIRAPRAPWREGVRLFDQIQLGRSISPHAFDAILYTVGNSHHYRKLYDLALAHPGVCWFHDVRLYGLYLHNALLACDCRRADAAAKMRETLRRLYGDRYASAKDEDLLDPEWYQNHGEIGLTGELTAASEMVVVHSEHALDLLKKDHARGPFPRAMVVPHAIPELRPRPGFRRTSSRPLLASFGIAHPIKGTALLLDAFARLAADYPFDLALVGPVSDDYRAELQDRARSLGIADRVTLTGRLPYEDYVDWLFRADCSVQLRLVAHGENSGAISDCIAAGVPVLTNSPTYLDMKGDFVRALPRDVTTEQIAAAVLRLLKDPKELADLRAAGKAYAEAWTFPRVVDRIFESISELWR